MPSAKKRIDVQIRWLIRRDMPEVLRIEQECFEYAWRENDFLHCLRQRNCIGMVAELGNEIHGFMIYELHKKSIFVLNMAVAPTLHGRGIGTQMIDRLKSKLSHQRRTILLAEVRERNVAAQLFLKSQGFEACETLRGHYEDTDEDCYVMKYTEPVGPQDNFALSNRILRVNNAGD